MELDVQLSNDWHNYISSPLLFSLHVSVVRERLLCIFFCAFSVGLYYYSYVQVKWIFLIKLRYALYISTKIDSNRKLHLINKFINNEPVYVLISNYMLNCLYVVYSSHVLVRFGT